MKVKCNTYSACRGNSRMIAYGFRIRDDKGDLIYAKEKGLGFSTNTEAKSISIKEALEYCFKNNVNDFIIVANSLSLKKMILRQWRIPWDLAVIIEDIREYILSLNITITHIFRKANSLTDSLANEEVEMQGL